MRGNVIEPQFLSNRTKKFCEKYPEKFIKMAFYAYQINSTRLAFPFYYVIRFPSLFGKAYESVKRI